MATFGIDVGATTTRVGVVDSAGRLLASDRTATPDDPRAFLEWVTRTAPRLADDLVGSAVRTMGPDETTGSAVRNIATDESASHDHRVTRAGLAVPGLLDRARATVRRSVALPWLNGRAIAAEFTEASGLPCVLLTDAEAATWGEYTARSPAPARFVHLRVGTGIACGVVLDGKLQRLDLDRNTHLEVLVVESGSKAQPCACGLTGCLETVASGRALADLARRAGFKNPPLPRGDRGGFSPQPSVERADNTPRAEADNVLAALNAAWQRGDEIATEIVQRAADALVTACGNLAAAFRPEVICLGGGVGEALPGLFPMTSRLFCACTWTDQDVPNANVEPALLGDDAGLLGAARRIFITSEGTL